MATVKLASAREVQDGGAGTKISSCSAASLCKTHVYMTLQLETPGLWIKSGGGDCSLCLLQAGARWSRPHLMDTPRMGSRTPQLTSVEEFFRVLELRGCEAARAAAARAKRLSPGRSRASWPPRQPLFGHSGGTSSAPAGVTACDLTCVALLSKYGCCLQVQFFCQFRGFFSYYLPGRYF